MRGVVPNLNRGAFIGVGELTTYDHVKHLLRDKGYVNEGFSLHAISSLITGLVATTVAAPFDLIKTRSMNDGGSTSLYKGPLDCLM